MTTWNFDNTDFADLGKVTVINDYLDFPPRRGNNQTIPFQHGTAFSAKYFDEREFAFVIAVVEDDADALEEKLDTIRALFAPRTEKVLEMTMDDASTRTINASMDRPMNVERRSDKIALVSITLIATRPFWRSSVETEESVTVNANPKTLAVTNGGTVEERNPTITLTGPLQDTVITNTTNGVSMTYTGTISGGSAVVITTNEWGEYTAILDGTTNVIGNVTHNGAAALMVLDVGSNSLSIADDTHTTGEVTIAFYPPYL